MRSYNKISERTGKGRNTSFKNELKQQKRGTSRLMFCLSQRPGCVEPLLRAAWCGSVGTRTAQGPGGHGSNGDSSAPLGAQGIQGSLAVEEISAIPTHSNTLLG